MFLSTSVIKTLLKKPFILGLGNNATVFQAEVFAVGRTASHLIFSETKNKNLVINFDSQAAIIALDDTKIKSKTTLDAVLVFDKLEENNHLRWIPAHSGFVGNANTNNHYIGQCPKMSVKRSAVLHSFYLCISEVVNDFTIFAIMNYINATGRLNTTTE